MGSFWALGMLIYGITFTVSQVWVLYQKWIGQAQPVTRPRLLYSLGVGLSFSAVTLLLYLTFARVNVSVGSPTIRVVGILLLKEPFTWRYALGVVFTLVRVG